MSTVKQNFKITQYRKILEDYFSISLWELNHTKSTTLVDFKYNHNQTAKFKTPAIVKAFLKRQDIIKQAEPMLNDPILMRVINKGDKILDMEYMLNYYFDKARYSLLENGGCYLTKRAKNYLDNLVNFEVPTEDYYWDKLSMFKELVYTFCNDDSADNKLSYHFETSNPYQKETIGVAIEHIRWIIEIMASTKKIQLFTDYINKQSKYRSIGILGDPREGYMHDIYLAKLGLIDWEQKEVLELDEN